MRSVQRKSHACIFMYERIDVQCLYITREFFFRKKEEERRVPEGRDDEDVIFKPATF